MAARHAIKEKPSSYLARIYYDSVVYTQDALELCLKVGGEDKLLYGSDYPHNIGDMSGCLARVNSLGSAVAAKVRDGNAMRIFNL
jgi:aminocarboxymuconate-semialdehyde decarboxylase